MWLDMWLINWRSDDASCILTCGIWHNCLVCITAISRLLYHDTSYQATRKFSFVICKLLTRPLTSFSSEATRQWNFWTFNKAVLWTINSSNVSLKCNQLHVSTSNVGNAMTGSLMYVLLACDHGELLLRPDRLLCGERCAWVVVGPLQDVEVHWTLPQLGNTDFQTLLCL